jgi:peptidyl-dipeptidase A
MIGAHATAILDRFEEEYEPIRRGHALALWRLATTGDADSAREVEELERRSADLLADPERFAAVEAALDGSDPASLDGRRLRLYRRHALLHQVPASLREELIQLGVEVEQVYGTFRATFEGGPVNDGLLDQVLREEPREERRREAWLATRQVGDEVAERVRQLARLRNRQAHHLGYPTFHELALEAVELDPSWLMELLGELERRSTPAYTRIKRGLDADLRRQYGRDDLQLWHYPERFLQHLPPDEDTESLDRHFPVRRIEAHAHSYFADLDLPIDELWAASDMLPREGKNQHAFSLPVEVPGDVRVLCNLVLGTRWMSTALHEFGHALYDRHVAPALPLLMRGAAHSLVTEGVAMFFGRLVYEPRWLEAVAGVPPDMAEASAATLRTNQILFLRWAMVVVHFERALYADPDGDLDAAWWGLVERFQGLSRPDGHACADWAAKIHVACYPVYYQNYVLGELVASQLHGALSHRLGHDDDPAAALLAGQPVGGFFRELFALGARHHWEETLRQITGSALSAGPYLQRFVGEP